MIGPALRRFRGELRPRLEENVIDRQGPYSPRAIGGTRNDGTRAEWDLRSWERDGLPLSGKSLTSMTSWPFTLEATSLRFERPHRLLSGHDTSNSTPAVPSASSAGLFSRANSRTSAQHRTARARPCSIAIGVYGAQRFSVACREQGVRPIIGADLTMADGSLLPVLVENRTGYANLVLPPQAPSAGARKEAVRALR
jgi:hypothetical protein